MNSKDHIEVERLLDDKALYRITNMNIATKKLFFVKLYLSLLSITVVTSTFCQGQNLAAKQHHYLTASLGVDSYYRGLPVAVVYEYGKKHFSFGAIMDVNLANYPANLILEEGTWKYRASYYGLRGSFHLDKLIRTPKIDLYIGAGGGYQDFSWNEDNEGRFYKYKNGISADYYIGSKFLLAGNFGTSIEFGKIGLSNLRVGVLYRIEEL